MEREEKITKLMNKTGVSHEDAERALNACNDDILDAVMYLEALGKVDHSFNTAYGDSNNASANTGNTYNNANSTNNNQNSSDNSFATQLGKFMKFCGRLIQKGMVNYMDIYKDGNCVFSIPLTVLVLLFIPFFWLMTVLLIVFLFLGCHYEFRGPNFKKDDTANDVLNKASKTCNTVKDDFKRGFEGTANDAATNNTTENVNTDTNNEL